MERISLRKFVACCTMMVFFLILTACGDDVSGASSVNHGGGDGESCTDSEQCESGVCHDGICARGCDESDDCVDDWICRDHGEYGLCEIPVDCNATGECIVDDDLCVVERQDDIRIICHPPIGDDELGDSCTGDEDCAAGLCLHGECSQPCNSAADCGDSEHYICSSENLGDGEEFNVCTERVGDSCLSDAECGDGDRCVATVDDEELGFTCGDPNDGGGEGGEGCTDDIECAQNLCLDGACAAPCDGDDICEDIPASSCVTHSVERDDAQGTVSTCDVPLHCDSAEVCDVDETCYVQRGEDAVHTVCNDPTSENRADGDPCAIDSQCGSNYCHEGRFGNYCSTPCQLDSDCPDISNGFAMECGETEIEHENGTDAVDICLQQDPDSCSSDDDCESGESCAVVVNAEDDGLETVCLPDNGGDDTGDSCVADDDCLSNLCYTGMCAAPCVEHGQCGDDQACEEKPVSQGGHSEDFDICVVIPEVSCSAPLQCTADYLTCNQLTGDADGNVTGAFCGMTNPGEAALGESCNEIDDCESDFCWESEDETTGQCSVMCEDSDRDCAHEQVCATMAANLGACLGACDRNEDCDGGNVCHLGVDPGGDNLHSYCDWTLGDNETGDTCTDSSDCDTGLCLTVSTYEVTDQICTGNTQCDSGFECRCPPDSPGCIDQQCVSINPTDEVNRCSKLCDMNNGDSDCAVGNHDMTRCTDNITVSWDGGSQSDTISACSMENAQ